MWVFCSVCFSVSVRGLARSISGGWRGRIYQSWEGFHAHGILLYILYWYKNDRLLISQMLSGRFIQKWRNSMFSSIFRYKTKCPIIYQDQFILYLLTCQIISREEIMVALPVMYPSPPHNARINLRALTWVPRLQKFQ